MFNYIKGKITEVNVGEVVIENNGIGYNVFVANPYIFTSDNEITLYLYNQIREDENSLYGFKLKEERDLFLKLLTVKGLGPKVGISFFTTGSVNGIIEAIEKENVLYLKKFPKVGEKLARQIIFDLKGKLGTIKKTDASTGDSFELVSALETLGYKSSDITKVIPNIDKSAPIENQIKDALKYLLK